MALTGTHIAGETGAIGDANARDILLNALTALVDPVISITYNGDGTPSSVTEAGVTTSYTYNEDGTVATKTRLGVTRTFTYAGGNLIGVS